MVIFFLIPKKYHHIFDMKIVENSCVYRNSISV